MGVTLSSGNPMSFHSLQISMATAAAAMGYGNPFSNTTGATTSGQLPTGYQFAPGLLLLF